MPPTLRRRRRRRRQFFSKFRSGRRDRFRPQIVKIGLILANFWPFSSFWSEHIFFGRKNVKKCTRHFWANFGDRPEILSNRIPICATRAGSPAYVFGFVFVWISVKVELVNWRRCLVAQKKKETIFLIFFERYVFQGTFPVL